jgi:hypothetical protein
MEYQFSILRKLIFDLTEESLSFLSHLMTNIQNTTPSVQFGVSLVKVDTFAPGLEDYNLPDFFTQFWWKGQEP